jgi:hypothetical protein
MEEVTYGMLCKEQKRLYDYLCDNDYNVHLFRQKEGVCAEVESWTEHDIDMIISLTPFTIENLEEYYNDFDVDEELMNQWNDPKFRECFTIRKALDDYDNWKDRLEETIIGFNQL